MKKLSDRHRAWLVRHTIFSAVRRLRSKRLAKARRNGSAPTRKVRHRLELLELRIAAPSDFSLASNFEAVNGFFENVLDALSGKRRVVVDFTTIERLAPAASLLLAATLDLWQRVKGIRLIARDVAAWHPHVRQMLVDIGLFELLQTRNPPGRPRPEEVSPVRLLKLRTGEGSDGSLARELGAAMVEIAGPIDAQRFLYVGLTEAMTNVAQHAYTDHGAEIPPDFKRWWMTGSYDEQQRAMRVIILDLGVGIPATLPRSSNWERIRGILAKLSFNDDAHMIAAAVEAGRSSTDMPERGHGLDEVRQFVENSASGRLRILSGRGEVVYEHGGKAAKLRNLPAAFGGTLIEWEVFR